MESPNERRRAFVEETLDRYPFLSWLGVEVDATESGRVVLSLPFDEDVLGSAGGAVGVTEVSVKDGPPGGGNQEIAIATMTDRLFRG
jgi:hypothetical protein